MKRQKKRTHFIEHSVHIVLISIVLFFLSTFQFVAVILVTHNQNFQKSNFFFSTKFLTFHTISIEISIEINHIFYVKYTYDSFDWKIY